MTPCSLANAQRGFWGRDEALDGRRERRKKKSGSRQDRKKNRALKRKTKTQSKKWNKVGERTHTGGKNILTNKSTVSSQGLYCTPLNTHTHLILWWFGGVTVRGGICLGLGRGIGQGGERFRVPPKL